MICDLAETYHIIDYEQLPPSTVAVLVSGLRGNSRVVMKMSGIEYPLETLLCASIADNLAITNYMLNYRFSGKRPKTPDRVFDKLLGKEQGNGNVTRKYKGIAFETPEELEAYMEGRKDG